MNFVDGFGGRADGNAPSVTSTARSHVGRVRAVNEDRTLDCADARLWAVADGMGGHAGGDVAADRAIAALRQLADAGRGATADTLAMAMDDANGAIRRLGHGERGMCGTTIVAATLRDRQLDILWVGDSRAYLVRAGVARQLTSDHSIVQELVDGGVLTAEQARSHPQSNVVTRALGIGARGQPDRVSVKTSPGDRVLLCSDGLSNSLDMADLCAGQPLEGAADRLIEMALQRDGSDNISLVLIDIA